MIGEFEVRRHAAFALEPAQERHTDQLTFQVITPVVIDARQVLAIAELIANQQRTAMGASVDEGVDAAVIGSGDNDGRVTDER